MEKDLKGGKGKAVMKAVALLGKDGLAASMANAIRRVVLKMIIRVIFGQEKE